MSDHDLWNPAVLRTLLLQVYLILTAPNQGTTTDARRIEQAAAKLHAAL